jgi:hypothetical protein
MQWETSFANLPKILPEFTSTFQPVVHVGSAHYYCLGTYGRGLRDLREMPWPRITGPITNSLRSAVRYTGMSENGTAVPAPLPSCATTGAWCLQLSRHFPVPETPPATYIYRDV